MLSAQRVGGSVRVERALRIVGDLTCNRLRCLGYALKRVQCGVSRLVRIILYWHLQHEHRGNAAAAMTPTKLRMITFSCPSPPRPHASAPVLLISLRDKALIRLQRFFCQVGV